MQQQTPSIDLELLARLMEAEGIASYNQLSQRMGVSHTTVSRVVNGRTRPGAQFIPGLKRAFPGRHIDGLINH